MTKNNEVIIVNLIYKAIQYENSRFVELFEHYFAAKNNYYNLLKETQREIPYFVNILDEIHGNENTHSRLLVRLLDFIDNEGKKPLLELFLNNLGEPFSTLKIHSPSITAEENRIDARIRDLNEKWSIIIENKIHGAEDQENQITRYLEIEKNSNFEFQENKIHILYLTLDGGCPSEKSLPTHTKKELINHNRYFEISFRNEILNWLNICKIKVETNNGYSISKDTKEILYTAIVQYKNHLEGIFKLRQGESMMTKTMIEFINSNLKIEKEISDEGKLKRIDEYLEYTNEINSYLQIIKNETENKIILSNLNKFCSNIIKEDFKIIDEIEKPLIDFGKNDSAILFHPKEWLSRFSIGIGFCENDLSYLFYGIRDKNENGEELITQFEKIFKINEDPSASWPFCKYIFRKENREQISTIFDKPYFINYFQGIINNVMEKTQKVTILRS